MYMAAYKYSSHWYIGHINVSVVENTIPLGELKEAKIMVVDGNKNAISQRRVNGNGHKEKHIFEFQHCLTWWNFLNGTISFSRTHRNAHPKKHTHRHCFICIVFNGRLFTLWTFYSSFVFRFWLQFKHTHKKRNEQKKMYGKKGATSIEWYKYLTHSVSECLYSPTILSLSFKCKKFALIWIEFAPNFIMLKKVL